MADIFKMTCDKCGKPHKFSLEQMHDELDKTISRLGMQAILIQDSEVKWLCSTCITAGKVGIN